MRESNFYFPAHNKASVSITSALYDRRAIDATSPLPLLSTLTHLSYLTSTSPRIRDILCSDGGLERLISILRSTGKRMREHRTNSNTLSPQIEISHPPLFIPIHPSLDPSPRPIVLASPFRSFLPSNHRPLAPDPTDPSIPPLNPIHAAHHAATLGLSKDQKQLLWTWSLSFQCVVNIGVRGTESIRTRVVEAGVVPVIISVLGGYLHELDRIRHLSESRERARKKSLLLAPPHHHHHHSRPIQPFSIDLHRPPRPVLSSRTLANPLPANQPPPSLPVRPSIITLPDPAPPVHSPQNIISPTVVQPPRPHSATTQSASTHHHRPSPNQYSANSDGPPATFAHQLPPHPIPINPPAELVFRTGSISPSSVSSSSSLETSRLHSAQHAIIHSVTSDTLRNPINSPSSTLPNPPALVDLDGQDHQQATRADDASPPLRSPRSDNDLEHHSGPDETDSDVVMELASSSEAGPSSGGHQRSRRGTIKASQSNNALVHITPLAPPRPTVTELNPLPSQAGPMDGIQPAGPAPQPDHPLDPTRTSNNSATPLFVNHQTPRASAARLPAPVSHRHHSPVLFPPPPAHDDDVLMANVGRDGQEDSPAEDFGHRVTLPSNFPAPHRPRLGAPQQPTMATTDAGRLPRVLTDTEAGTPAGTFTTRHTPPAAPPAVPITVMNLPTQAELDAGPVPGGPGGRAPATATVNATAGPTAGATATAAAAAVATVGPTAPVSLGFRDEDVLLALQLLAYLSKYAHVRAYFHEPASRATLELTYGSLHEATRALGRFVGQFKSERQERERGKQALGAAQPGSSRRPASAQGHQLAGPSGLRDEAGERARGIGHQAQPHRSLSSSMMRERMLREEAAQEEGVRAGLTLFSTAPSQALGGLARPTSSGMPLTGTTMRAEHDQLCPHHRAHPPTPINPLASNVFSYVERFTHQRLPHDHHTPAIPTEIQYWAGVIMRNACRKDDDRGGIRQCANMQCGRWESFPREFAKCRRCRKAKYCSKNCQSRAWQLGHRFWCCTKTDGETGTASAAGGPTEHLPSASNGESDDAAGVGAGGDAAIGATTLVDAAIERLRRGAVVGGPAGGGRLARTAREIDEAGSNIPTPPDREPRPRAQPDGPPGAGIGQTGNPVGFEGGVENERDRIRLMVENEDEGNTINP